MARHRTRHRARSFPASGCLPPLATWCGGWATGRAGPPCGTRAARRSC